MKKWTYQLFFSHCLALIWWLLICCTFVTALMSERAVRQQLVWADCPVWTCRVSLRFAETRLRCMGVCIHLFIEVCCLWHFDNYESILLRGYVSQEMLELVLNLLRWSRRSGFEKTASSCIPGAPSTWASSMSVALRSDSTLNSELTAEQLTEWSDSRPCPGHGLHQQQACQLGQALTPSFISSLSLAHLTWKAVLLPVKELTLQ